MATEDQLSFDNVAAAEAAFEPARAAELQACADGRDLLDDFLAGRQNAFTRAGYRAALERFASFCAHHSVDPARADTRLVCDFRDALAAAVAASSVRLDLAAVSSFFRWLTCTGVRADNPAAAIERPPREGDHTSSLAPSAAITVVEAARGQGPRPFALCCLFLLYGLPTSAVAKLDAADVRPSGLPGPQLRAALHGGGRRLYALAGPATEALPAQARAAGEDGALFPGDGRHGRAGRHTLAAEVARVATAALPGTRVTPQVLRATHREAVRGELSHLFTDTFGDRRLRLPPPDLAEAVWRYLNRQTDPAVGDRPRS